MKNLLYLITIISVFSISCSPKLSPAQINSDKKAILKVMDDQTIAWNKGDIDSFMEGYVKSDELKFVGSKGITRGWQATLERYKKSYPDIEIMGQLTFTDLEFNFTSKTTAIVYGKYTLIRKNDKPTGYFTLNWQKIHGKWLIISDHTC